MAEKQDLPTFGFATSADWEAWLSANHASSAGLWLKLGKRGATVPNLTYDEALAAALCYGWIDGQLRTFNDQCYLQRFSPRRPGSKWSQRNRTLVADLIAEGRMRPAGLRAVDAAKADGHWNAAYAGSNTATVPDDLQSALDANPAARAFFDTLDRQNRFAILYRIQDATRPETRARRIARLVAMLAEGQKLYP